MGTALETLLEYRHASDAYDVPFAEVCELQVAAMNERLQDRIDRIRLVKFRAEAAGLTAITNFADVVPLLLPHTAYKSYPENFLLEEKWHRLTAWLGTVSTYPLDDVDLEGIAGVDDWIARLDAAGHPVSCSSGTTGKSAMLIASQADLDWVSDDAVRACTWALGVEAEQDRQVFNLSPIAAVPRNIALLDRLQHAFGKPGTELFRYPVPPITIGAVTRMVALRKAVAEGKAMPAEIAEFERTGSERAQALEAAIGITVDALLNVRGEKLYLAGYWAGLYKLAVAVRERGFAAKDFHPANISFIGGGLKREDVPADYQEFICETFNIAPGGNFQFYGMQELGSIEPRCGNGRYHIPPWVVCLPLNKAADALLPMEGEVQCRAGFFDLSLDGRWGGVITGDRIEVDFEPCACGARSPSIRDNVVRYADLEGDDKINCAGTVDAYVRGLA